MNTRKAWIASACVMAFLAMALLLVIGERSIAQAAAWMPGDLNARTDHGWTSRNITVPITTTGYLIRLPMILKIPSEYLLERAALIALYDSTDGNNWGDHTGWKTDESYCNWHGVTCDVDNHVIELALSWDCDLRYCWGSLLRGSIPPEIGNLSHLQILYLRGNQLSGSIPAEIGNLSYLRNLFLPNNQLSGSIPKEIGNLSYLQNLYLSGNQLSGSIPASLSNLPRLQYLHLENNPDLQCWQTPEALNWALSLTDYSGPISVCKYFYIHMPLICSNDE